MIPVPSKCIKQLKYNNVDNFRTFSNKNENEEAKIINNAKKLYNICLNFPNSSIASRCCDFKALENVCLKWEQK